MQHPPSSMHPLLQLNFVRKSRRPVEQPEPSKPHLLLNGWYNLGICIVRYDTANIGIHFSHFRITVGRTHQINFRQTQRCIATDEWYIHASRPVNNCFVCWFIQFNSGLHHQPELISHCQIRSLNFQYSSVSQMSSGIHDQDGWALCRRRCRILGFTKIRQGCKLQESKIKYFYRNSWAWVPDVWMKINYFMKICSSSS